MRKFANCCRNAVKFCTLFYGYTTYPPKLTTYTLTAQYLFWGSSRPRWCTPWLRLWFNVCE